MPQETLVRGFPGQRYRSALGKIGPVETYPGHIAFVDVGGFGDNPVLAALLPDARIVSLNIPHEYHGRFGDVTYDGQHMPIASGAVPVAMAVDVLEHVVADKRLKLLSEMVRVAQKKVVVSGPFASLLNEDYEKKLLGEMEARGLPAKRSIVQHRINGLPTIDALVAMSRQLGYPFSLSPATTTALDFQGLLAQVNILGNRPEDGKTLAEALAQETDQLLTSAPTPTWQQAYRAVLVIEKVRRGQRLGEDKLFLSSDETTAYQAALSAGGYGRVEDLIRFCRENPLRGRHIVLEGPEGSGKTTVMRRVTDALMQWGYTVANPTDYGLRQDIRTVEKQRQQLFPEPARGLYFAHAMVETTIAGNAHTLLGPCSVAIDDRGLASVPMHHDLYCRTDETIPMLLKRHAPKVAPDLTIVLSIEDEDFNWKRLKATEDLANRERTWEQLIFQRAYYQRLEESPLTGPIVRIINPGTDGTLDDVVTTVLRAIAEHCRIPTRVDNP